MQEETFRDMQGARIGVSRNVRADGELNFRGDYRNIEDFGGRFVSPMTKLAA